MALIECRECKSNISDKAESCPQCGAKQPKKTSVFTWIMAGIFGILVYSCTIGKSNYVTPIVSAPTTPVTASTTSQAPESQPLSSPKPEGISKWEYDNGVDDMSGKPRVSAFINSEDKLKFDFPYNGGSTATLQVRKQSKDGTKVILRIDKGQFLCRYDGCSVSLKFDNASPFSVSASEPSDHSSTALFLGNEKRIIQELKKSKTLKVEALFFHEGSRVMTFKPYGLEWK